MSELVANCPRCGACKITFDLKAAHIVRTGLHGWQQWYETFSICRHCNKATIFLLSDSVNADYKDFQRIGLLNFKGAINYYTEIEGFINLSDLVSMEPPEHLPDDIRCIFQEASKCLSIGCVNASGTMFRLCVDVVTKQMLPAENENGLNEFIRRNLGLRLNWLFDRGKLPDGLRELATCIREDGNDSAHVGNLSKPDAEDLADFTVAILERIYTEPKRLNLARERREERRKEKSV